jgi:hypothetical protein
MMAALNFAVALRLEPSSARSVLDAIGEREGLALQLVRGDALRILGLEGDAGRAYQSVANALGAPRPTAKPKASEPAEPELPAAASESAAAIVEPVEASGPAAVEGVSKPEPNDPEDSGIHWE